MTEKEIRAWYAQASDNVDIIARMMMEVAAQLARVNAQLESVIKDGALRAR